jgi:RNA polymerase sigma-70 factor (ECF subfamily)
MGVELSPTVVPERENYAPPLESGVVAMTRGWGELYRDHADFVWRSLRRMGLSPDEAKDSLHDVFLIVHRRFDSFDPNLGSERAWLFGIAANVARSERRRRRPIPVERVEPLLDHQASVTGADAPSSSGEYRIGYLRVREKIMEAVGALSPERRAVFTMFELEGMSCLEIADEMGVVIGTVYSRLHSAREQLRIALSDYKPEGSSSRRGI